MSGPPIQRIAVNLEGFFFFISGNVDFLFGHADFLSKELRSFRKPRALSAQI